MKTLMLASLLLLAGCASMGGAGAPPVDVKGADVSKRTMDNGDTIEEYRVSGQLRLGRSPRSEICSRGWERSTTGIAPVGSYRSTPNTNGS